MVGYARVRKDLARRNPYLVSVPLLLLLLLLLFLFASSPSSCVLIFLLLIMMLLMIVMMIMVNIQVFTKSDKVGKRLVIRMGDITPSRGTMLG